jgi:zinc transport system substrate-binding protein
MKIRTDAIFLILLCCVATLLTGCSRNEVKPAAGLQVVTSLFPLYDFARTIAGDKARVTLLLPPGMEPHTFEPKPEDLIRISRAGLFIYTSPYMEPWADKVIKGIDNKSLRIVDAGQRVRYIAAVSADSDHREAGESLDHEHKGMDPHIWLDFTNAAVMVDTILEGFISADPANASLYRRNSEALKARLASLDERYRNTLAICDTRKLLHAGHYTFGYLARRYNLEYHALSGVSSDSEPSAARMAALIRQIRLSGTKYLFAEEILSPRLAETVAEEAGVQVLTLHGAHNLSRDEFLKGATFFDLMETNLERLQKGLQCRSK